MWSSSTSSITRPRQRRAALADLAAWRVSVVFSVDLFNEGIDVPVVDTLLLLRPTDSPTLFLQQLGRGLRLSPGKTVCTVLDFVGLHRKEFLEETGLELGEVYARQKAWSDLQVRAELLELLDVLASRVDHVHRPLATHPDVPLQVHARYSRIELFAAFGLGAGAKVAPWQTGVYWAREASTDLLAFTLDKTSGQFSPTTRYRDYAISRELIHWESQSTTRADSETGRRYQNHVALKSAVISSRACAVTSGPSGSWGRPPTSATSPSSQWL